jgi:hypothetical protein
MNAFKTVRRNLASNNASTVLAYKTKEANFNLAVDFPSLSSSSSSSSSSSNTTSSNATIDYSHTFAPAPVPDIIPNPDITNILEPRIPPPGWHKYSWNKSTRIMTADYGKGAGPYANAAPDDEYIEGQHFIKMMTRLEETQLSHAEQFIECYGYDCYEHTFLMPHYSPQYFSDGNYNDVSDYNSNSEDDF